MVLLAMIALLTRSLQYGGAERQLVELARGLKRKGSNVVVIVFYPGGPLSASLIEAGITIMPLDKQGRWDVLPFFLRFLHVLRAHRPQVLYAFLGIPCILSVFVKKLVPNLKIIWGVRASNVDLSQYGWLPRYAYRLECALSVFADLIISNSQAGKKHAISSGFPDQKVVVVPNGIDIDKFKPCRSDGERLRKEWGVTPTGKLVGLVARLDPIKDHSTFINAAKILTTIREDVWFVCVGDGPLEYRQRLVELSHKVGLEERIVWAGEQKDMQAVYNALDVTVLSSKSEGFPNVIAEAMACGVPCVVTDVGDAAWIIGDTGIVVPPQNPAALADGLQEVLTRLEDWRKENIKENVRLRICDHFGLDVMVDRTADVLAGLQ